uniref:Ribosome biogenesis GTPase A n=1 Tax=Tetraselmis sp. GSL018 TaxID=582737 RepID=A0A061RFW5_9CHLO
MSGAVSWFPGHMHKALKQMHRQLKAIDLVLEVRDARVPFSASNAEFDKLITHKRRIVVLSKSDLADPSFEQVIARRLQGQKQKPFFTSLSDPSSVRKLVGACRSWLKQESSAVSHLLMVVGLPNTGKSSLINAMRRQQAPPPAPSRE